MGNCTAQSKIGEIGMDIEIKGKKYVVKNTVLNMKKTIGLYKGTLEMVELSKSLQNLDGDVMKQAEIAVQVTDKVVDLLEKKCELFVSVCDNQFSVDEVENSVSSDEINEKFNELVLFFMGKIPKNA